MAGAEKMRWRKLRHRRFDDYHFRNKCRSAAPWAGSAASTQKLMVEVDGSRHADSATKCGPAIMPRK
jgi:very-short-patch-repair endonuclease